MVRGVLVSSVAILLSPFFPVSVRRKLNSTIDFVCLPQNREDHASQSCGKNAAFSGRGLGGLHRRCFRLFKAARGKEVEGGDEANEGRVLVLAATNTPWMIDQAFLRPGRFDRVVHVGLPDVDDRISILGLHTGRMKTEFAGDAPKVLALCKEIAMKTVGFSGADLAALCREAAIRCLVEQSDCVQAKHFFETLDDGLKASCSSSLVDRIKGWRP